MKTSRAFKQSFADQAKIYGTSKARLKSGEVIFEEAIKQPSKLLVSVSTPN